jgi:phage terminase large subunit-like protein
MVMQSFPRVRSRWHADVVDETPMAHEPMEDVTTAHKDLGKMVP